MGFEFSHFKSLVNVAIDNNASDIHIRAEETPCFRINGDMVSVKSNKTLTTESVLDILRLLTKDNKQIGNLEDIKDLDGAVDFEDICRLRFNYFRYNNKNGIVLRVVKKEIPSFKELGLSDSLKQIIILIKRFLFKTGQYYYSKLKNSGSMI